MSYDARHRALRMLEEQPRRDIYEGASEGGKAGSGLFYVTYSDGQSPELTRKDIDLLLESDQIERKWPQYDGCFVLKRT